MISTAGSKIFWMLLSFFSFMAFSICLFANIPNNFSYLPFLPLACFLVFGINVFLMGNYELNISIVLLNALMLARYALLPLLLIAGDFSSIFSSNLNDQFCNTAILLMIYEFIAITLAVFFSNRNFSKFEKGLIFFEIKNRAFFLLMVMLLFVIAIYLAFPDTKDYFNTIFQVGSVDFTYGNRLDSANTSFVKKSLQTVFAIIFKIVRIMIPIYIVKFCIEAQRSQKEIFTIIFIFIFLQFVFISNTFAESIVSSLIILCASSKLDKKIAKKILLISPVFILFVILGYFYVRYSVAFSFSHSSIYAGNNAFSYVSSVYSAYFTGVQNVAASLYIPKEDFFDIHMSTLLNTIPFNTAIFGQHGMSMQGIYNKFNGTLGQIPSTIGDGYFTFGILAAPVYSFLLSYASVFFCKLADKYKSTWHYVSYMFLSIVFALGIAMYNEHIALTWAIQWGLPILLISFFIEKKST